MNTRDFIAWRTWFAFGLDRKKSHVTVRRRCDKMLKCFVDKYNEGREAEAPRTTQTARFKSQQLLGLSQRTRDSV